ncbi:unnamed protein product [Paramecium pentaurelia]|uniref:3'-5' exonuclease domain-containing protein n=1 Tax=Paramecium pentaurelia TaxID=43138 RepID=A0A8S1XJF7_9CILI|nr:unnamed protein product [Paramecium pentaurelia]
MQQKLEQEEEVRNDNEFIQILQKVIIECDGFYELSQYLTINNLSFNLIQNLFLQVVNQDNIKEKLEQNLQKIIEEFVVFNVPRQLLKVLFLFLQKNKDQMNLKQYQDKGIVKIWKDLKVQDMLEFLNLFSLKEQIPEKEFEKYFKNLLYKQKFEDAYLLYKNIKLPKDCFDHLIQQMQNKRETNKAAEFIKNSNYNPADYPKVVEVLQKNCIKYMSKEHPWYKSEEMLLYQPQLLALLCENAYYNGLPTEALSIIKRNNLIDLIKTRVQEEKLQINYHKGFQEIPNILFEKDEFKPTEEFVNNEIGVYLHCKDFGYTENQIILIDKVDENYFDAWKYIHSSNAVGYDCEHVTPWTKLDYYGFRVCLVQIATKNHVFIFDYQKLKEALEFKKDVRQLMENAQIMKIGLGVEDDLKHTVNYLKLKNIKIRSVIELSSCFKLLEEENKKKSLAYITEFYFLKKLSKYETCSNWEYRPLRKAQTHYAALDAIISLQIYLKMKEKNNDLIEQQKNDLSMG